ncbi:MULTISPECIES: hypothetical protein [unclassified Microbacterium]|uniref:hypothetical protein n=1 Tax=unclassified Microbacterium TaxID=2609290 RepID=UPI0024684063|nr:MULTISPECIES: hypothetical protein [unclassified Microbacterium]MDH5134080.1 hypothetical protein [Microbacterium sp. RD10]MDH5136816.1 hypothetical protein [Microbacterium sp. RD11]MDH5146403.1 hypothetical protein [Microbacterium sp. RD12]MDH5155137.1 hypothetical protein [Microbacterium sp. RD06]MDH5166581.1 hypothetical protein [Microbacterium sp. RD02]
MGGLVIETIRPGVQFTPKAAAAFRRAEAQVLAELGRRIDVNSTWRNWDVQLSMFNAWQAYISGRGPYPGHSKALHPADPLAFHTKGLALDSDDWTNSRVVAILAENGFIRNRLYVPNERHHFEYIRARDRNYGKPASVSGGASAPKPGATAILEELTDMDKALIVQVTTKNGITWALVGATVPGGFRMTRVQETANAWAVIYGPGKKLDQADYDIVIREAKALAASWLAQQKQIHA